MLVLNSKRPAPCASLPHLRAWISAAHFLALAGIHDLLGVDGIFVNLLFENFPVFADQEVDAARGFVLVDVDAVLAGDISTHISQKREGDAEPCGHRFLSV